MMNSAQLAGALDTMSQHLLMRNWLQEGKQGLDDELRGDLDMEIQAGKFIRFITKHLKSDLGAFYLLNEEDSLVLTASYAFTDRAGNFNNIKIGEGLIGQAAKGT